MEGVPRPRHFYTEPERLDVGEVRVAYRRQGEGEPVLYLHGNGFTRMWLPFHERLAESMDLIAPEHPGYGETRMPAWLAGFDDLVVHYDELLDLLGLETELTDDLGAGMPIGAGGHIGSMPHGLAMESMQRMAEGVMPYFRAEVETSSAAR